VGVELTIFAGGGEMVDTDVTAYRIRGELRELGAIPADPFKFIEVVATAMMIPEGPMCAVLLPGMPILPKTLTDTIMANCEPIKESMTCAYESIYREWHFTCYLQGEVRKIMNETLPFLKPVDYSIEDIPSIMHCGYDENPPNMEFTNNSHQRAYDDAIHSDDFILRAVTIFRAKYTDATTKPVFSEEGGEEDLEDFFVMMS